MNPGVPTSHVTLRVLKMHFPVYPVSLEVKLQCDLLNIDEPLAATISQLRGEQLKAIQVPFFEAIRAKPA